MRIILWLSKSNRAFSAISVKSKSCKVVHGFLVEEASSTSSGRWGPLQALLQWVCQEWEGKLAGRERFA